MKGIRLLQTSMYHLVALHFVYMGVVILNMIEQMFVVVKSLAFQCGLPKEKQRTTPGGDDRAGPEHLDSVKERRSSLCLMRITV